MGMYNFNICFKDKLACKLTSSRTILYGDDGNIAKSKDSGIEGTKNDERGFFFLNV